MSSFQLCPLQAFTCKTGQWAHMPVCFTSTIQSSLDRQSSNRNCTCTEHAQNVSCHHCVNKTVWHSRTWQLHCVRGVSRLGCVYVLHQHCPILHRGCWASASCGVRMEDPGPNLPEIQGDCLTPDRTHSLSCVVSWPCLPFMWNLHSTSQFPQKTQHMTLMRKDEMDACLKLTSL